MYIVMTTKHRKRQMMANKNSRNKKTSVSSVGKIKNIKQWNQWQKITAFAVIFGVVGSILLFKSFAASTPTIKAQISGTIDRQGPPVSGYSPAVTNWVINATWASIQTTKGGSLYTAAIDSQIMKASSAGAHVKLRVTSGVDAPSWAQEVGGPSMHICNNDGATLVCGQVPRYWTSAYR